MSGNGQERQIWQRVMAQQEEPGEMKTLAFWAREDEAAFRALSQRLTGMQREQALELLEMARRKIACLEGIRCLAGEDRGGGPLPLPREPNRRLLEQSYRRSVRSAAGFTARMADRWFGAVFRVLATREEAQCAAIAELLGFISFDSAGRSSTPRSGSS